MMSNQSRRLWLGWKKRKQRRAAMNHGRYPKQPKITLIRCLKMKNKKKKMYRDRKRLTVSHLSRRARSYLREAERMKEKAEGGSGGEPKMDNQTAAVLIRSYKAQS